MQAGPADFLKGLARRNAFLETRLRALHGAAEFTLGEEIAAFRFADEREVERRPGGEQAAQGEESSQPPCLSSSSSSLTWAASPLAEIRPRSRETSMSEPLP